MSSNRSICSDHLGRLTINVDEDTHEVGSWRFTGRSPALKNISAGPDLVALFRSAQHLLNGFSCDSPSRRRALRPGLRVQRRAPPC
jgi:hypothetical protein